MTHAAPPSDAAGATAALRRGGARGNPRPRGPAATFITLLLMFAGVIVLVYPVVATQYNNVKQHSFANRYNEQVQQVDGNALASDLANARAYNQRIEGIPILDPYLLQVARDPGSPAYRDYNAQLALVSLMARLRVPSAQIDLPVYHGTSDDVLAKGVGHMYGTSLPVGGEGSHAVLTSHTGMANATLFDHLTSVKLGDQIYVDVDGETLTYLVDDIQIVLPDNISLLKSVSGQDRLTLFTCYPYAVNTHRLMVSGHRIPTVPTQDQAKPISPVSSALMMQPWMYGMLGAAALATAGMCVVLFRELKRRRNQPASTLVQPDGSIAPDATAATTAEPSDHPDQSGPIQRP